MFLLVPAYPGCPGLKAVKRSLLLLLLFFFVFCTYLYPVYIYRVFSVNKGFQYKRYGL